MTNPDKPASEATLREQLTISLALYNPNQPIKWSVGVAEEIIAVLNEGKEPVTQDSINLAAALNRVEFLLKERNTYRENLAERERELADIKESAQTDSPCPPVQNEQPRHRWRYLGPNNAPILWRCDKCGAESDGTDSDGLCKPTDDARTRLRAWMDYDLPSSGLSCQIFADIRTLLNDPPPKLPQRVKEAVEGLAWIRIRKGVAIKVLQLDAIHGSHLLTILDWLTEIDSIPSSATISRP